MDFEEDFNEEIDEEFDEDLEDELEEDLEEELDEPSTKSPIEDITIKTPDQIISHERKKISVYFLSTIGPGEKKQKLLVYTGNKVGDIKETVANLFALDPADFHLSSGGVTMDEISMLSDFNVADGDDILLIPASVAG